jgi:hypothetical protein
LSDDGWVCTGSDDGKIRLIHLLPNYVVKVLGHHQSYPVERMVIDQAKTRLVSCGHDGFVRTWDLRSLWNYGRESLNHDVSNERPYEDKMNEVYQHFDGSLPPSSMEANLCKDKQAMKKDTKECISQYPTAAPRHLKKVKYDDFFSDLC